MQQRKVSCYGITTTVACFLALALSPAPAVSQTTESATTTTGGNWTDPSVWTCTPALSPCLPNNGEPAGDVYDVEISGGINGGYLVSLGAEAATVNSLSITSGGQPYTAGLLIENGGSLTTAGDILNGGGRLTTMGALNSNIEVGGGGTLRVNGNLIDAEGQLSIVDGGTVTVNGAFDNKKFGFLQIGGGSTSGTESTLTVAAPAPSTFSGYFDFFSEPGDAVVNYQRGGGIIQLGNGGENPGAGFLWFDGPNASIEVDGVAGNSALDSLKAIATNGYLELQGGASAATGGNLNNAGFLAVANGLPDLSSALTVAGNLVNRGSTIIGYWDGFGPGTITVDGSVENTRSLQVNAYGSLGAASFVNLGGVSVASAGAIELDRLGSYWQIGGGASTSVEGMLTAGSLVVQGGTYTDDTGVTNLGAISGTPPAGSINIGSNASLRDNATVNVGSSTTPGTVNNAGRVRIGSAGTMTLADGGTYTQTGGLTDVNGTLVAPNVAINGGVLAGTGTIEGVTTIGANGRLMPGIPGVGRITFNGASSQPALDVLGTWDESIYFSSLFSATDVNGDLTLSPSSELDILMLPLYHPKVGTSFTIADFSSLSGTFGSILNDTFDNGREDWIISYNPTGIVLTVGRVKNDPDPPADAPEPTSAALFSLGMTLLGLIVLRRRCGFCQR